jgi:hypothetical protein
LAAEPGAFRAGRGRKVKNKLFVLFFCFCGAQLLRKLRRG